MISISVKTDIQSGIPNAAKSLPVTQSTKEIKIDTQESLEIRIYIVSGHQFTKPR